MAFRGVTVETIHNPLAYSARQIDQACAVAKALRIPRFLLSVAPEHCVNCLDQPETFCVECGRS